MIIINVSSRYSFFIVCLFCIFNMPGVFAQSGPHNIENIFSITASENNSSELKKAVFKGRRMEISFPSPIAVVGRDEIQQTFTSTLPDITQVVNYTRAGVMTSTQTTINLRGLGNTRTVMVNNTRYGYNPDASLVHSQSITRDLNNIPLLAIEQIQVIKGPSNVVYGTDAVSGKKNFTRGAGLDERFKSALYDPYYDEPLIDYQAVTGSVKPKWKPTIDAVFLRGDYDTKLPDNTYGLNGWRTIKAGLNGDFIIESTKYYDKNSNLRHVENTEWYPEYYSSTEKKYYSCEGKVDFSALEYTDQYGYGHDLMRTKFNNGNPYSGSFLPDSSCDQSFQQFYNPKSEVFGSPDNIFKSTPGIDPFGYYDIPLPGKFTDVLCDTMQSYMPTDTSDDYNHNVFTAGVNFRFEDFGGSNREAFFGANVSYTHFFKGWVGATADVGLNFGKIGNTNYTIGSYFGGPTFVPFKAAGINDKFTLSIHTLGGYTGVTTKNTGGTNSNGNFSLKLGLRGDFNFTKNLGIYLGADDYMVLGKGFTSNNYAVSLGARLALR